jgi:uncharacterized phage protein (TIGR01671 family)
MIKQFRAWDIKEQRYASHNLHLDGSGVLFWSFGYNEHLIDDQDNFILEQFSGKLDIKANRIFDGDIVEIVWNDDVYCGTDHCVVFFDETDLSWCCKDQNGHILGLINDYESILVIGNIHENLELLQYIM